MTSPRSYLDYLIDIVDAIEKTKRFIQGLTYEEFRQDDKTVFAVIRALEIVGEATKQIPSSVRASYPDIPWREMAGMRDKLIHDYLGVNLLVVWRTATEDMPAVLPMLTEILDDANGPLST